MRSAWMFGSVGSHAEQFFSYLGPQYVASAFRRRLREAGRLAFLHGVAGVLNVVVAESLFTPM